MKAFGYVILSILFRITIFLTRLLPERIVYCFCNRLSSLFIRSSRRYRRRIRKNLKIAFGPSCNNQYVEDITRTLTKNIGLSCAETLISATRNKDAIFDSIRLHGTENLDHALSHGKGVLAVSAHLGNFTLIGAKMLREGYPFTTLVKEFKHPAIAKVTRKIQNEQGGRFIYMDPWSKAVRQILSSLKRNEIVCLVADEKRKHTGIVVEFFGEPALTATGPALFSLKTGAPILPIFIVRDDDHAHHIYIEPQLTYNQNGNPNEDIHTITLAYTTVIEKYIRRYPDQWFWINNRWKTKRTRRSV